MEIEEKKVYWVTTDPCTFKGAQVVFLRFGHTKGEVGDRVHEWKNYCPLPLTTTVGHIKSVNSIEGQPDDAVRRLLRQKGFRLSPASDLTDWFILPEAQPGNVAIQELVRRAFVNAGERLTKDNIDAVINAMNTSMNK
ncbi:hypothetical protein NCS52_01345000 [Fusarium sp. LHS14.1]|nr:hypothetical protein NCS52_01345000 [Fusarium sp. LHS14.1]